MLTAVKDRSLVLPRHSTLAAHIHRVSHNIERVNLADLGIFLPIEGGARGVNTEGDVLTQTIDGRSLNDIWNEFQQTLQMHNERRQRIVDMLTFPVSQPIEDVPQVTGDDFEEASEFGEPKRIRGGDYFSMAYDFKWYDVGLGYTWKYLAEATAAQVESLNNMVLEADNRLIFKKIMKAVFNNADRTASIRQQSYNVYPFYNGDGTVPPDYKSYTFDGTHTHYFRSGAATIDSGDLDDLETHLKHHGYGFQNGSRMFLMVNSAQSAIIKTFRVATGASYDFIPSQGQPPFLLPTNTGGIQGGQVPSALNGLFVIGNYGHFLVVEEDYIPAGYVLAFATGGELQATNPVGFREHQNPGLRGLRLVKGRQADYPLVDSFYQRGFGTGVRHRGAGAVLQLATAGSYAIPSDYA
jgi:hypothetical protein